MKLLDISMDNTTTPINTFANLDSIFNTERTPVENLLPAISIHESTDIVPTTDQPLDDFPSTKDLQDDYQKARDSLRSLIDKGELVVDNMLNLAVQTESARSFEVAGNLIKTMSEVAKDLVGLHKAANDAKKKSDKDSKPTPQVIKNTQNNVVFQGTNTELFDMMTQDNDE